MVWSNPAALMKPSTWDVRSSSIAALGSSRISRERPGQESAHQGDTHC